MKVGLESISLIFNWLFILMPEIMAIVIWVMARSEYKKCKRKYGKKYAVSSDIFSDVSLGQGLFIEIVLSIIVVLSIYKIDALYMYSLKAYLILIPISTLTIAYITIVYSSQNNKYIFFSDIDVIRSKSADVYVKGIVLTLFINIALSAIIRLKFFDNDYLIVTFVLFNSVSAGLCMLFCAYVCWIVSSIVFSPNGGKKLLNRLRLIFDLHSVDMSFADKISFENETGSISNSICYLTENYVSYYDMIKGNKITNISLKTSIDDLTPSQTKKWKIKNVIKCGVVYCIFILLAWSALWINDLKYGLFFLDVERELIDYNYYFFIS